MLKRRFLMLVILLMAGCLSLRITPSVLAQDSTPIKVGEAVQVHLTPPDGKAIYEFEATAGDHLRVVFGIVDPSILASQGGQFACMINYSIGDYASVLPIFNYGDLFYQDFTPTETRAYEISVSLGPAYKHEGCDVAVQLVNADDAGTVEFPPAGGTGESQPAGGETASESQDADGDGFAGTDDRCPDAAGTVGGCPDTDRDGIVDAEDQCPDQAGTLNGCPDTDSDGIVDAEDQCPDKAGTVGGCPDTDRDGIVDAEDQCPDKAGTLNGCPDGDGDGVSDLADACPEVAGAFGGCPDADGDAVGDPYDKCPTVAGSASAEGCVLEVVNAGNAARLADLRSLELSGTLYNFLLTPDGRTALAVTDQETTLWDVAAARPLRPLIDHDLVGGHRFSPTGTTLYGQGYESSEIGLWDVATGKPLVKIEKAPQSVPDVRFSPDGKALVVVLQDAEDIQIYDAATGEPLAVLKGQGKGDREQTNDLIFSADGSVMISAGTDYLAFWDTKTFENLATLPLAVDTSIPDLMLSPDGSLLAVRGDYMSNSVFLLDVAQRAVKYELKTQQSPWGMGFSPDGTLFAVGDFGGTVSLWDTAAGQQVKTFGEAAGIGVSDAFFSPDSTGLWVIKVSYSSTPEVGSLTLWDIATGEQRVSYDTTAYINTSPDGTLLRWSSYGDTVEEKLLDASTGQVVFTFENATWVNVSDDWKVFIVNTASEGIHLFGVLGE